MDYLESDKPIPQVAFSDMNYCWGVWDLRRKRIILALSLLGEPIEKQYHTVIHETLHCVLGFEFVNGRCRWHTPRFKRLENELLSHFNITPIRKGKAIRVSGLMVGDKRVW